LQNSAFLLGRHANDWSHGYGGLFRFFNLLDANNMNALPPGQKAANQGQKFTIQQGTGKNKSGP